MQEDTNNNTAESSPPEVRVAIRDAIQEFFRSEQSKSEPVYKTELAEERRRRETLEKRVNELVEENKQSRHVAEEADKNSVLRTELQRLGVQKVDLAFKAIKDDVVRTSDGRLVGRNESGEAPLRDFLNSFVAENPELLPARIPGGTGSPAQQRQAQSPAMDLSRIRPGMNPEELEKFRQEVARAASQALKGF